MVDQPAASASTDEFTVVTFLLDSTLNDTTSISFPLVKLQRPDTTWAPEKVAF